MNYNNLPGSLPLESPTRDRIHVFLVETKESLNIGSVARAMSNLGFSHLHLVAPQQFDPTKAKKTACWATSLVDTAQIHADLNTAVAEMQDVIGFSARPSPNRPAQLLLPQWCQSIQAGPTGKIGLVFGSENEGLGREHLELCRTTVRIPSHSENPVYNLAQSVLLALYEVSRLEWKELSEHPQEELPDWNDFYQLDRSVHEAASACGYFRAGTPQPVPGLIKNLFRRMQPNRYELRVLLGLFGKLSRTLRREFPDAAIENVESAADIEQSVRSKN